MLVRVRVDRVGAWELGMELLLQSLRTGAAAEGCTRSIAALVAARRAAAAVAMRSQPAAAAGTGPLAYAAA